MTMALVENLAVVLALAGVIVSILAHVIGRSEPGGVWETLGVWLTGLSLLGLVVALAARGVRADRWPFVTRYEFALCFAAGILLAKWILHLSAPFEPSAAALTGSAAALLLIYAQFILPESDRQIVPLVPALRSIWFPIHVLAAVIGYGGAAVAAGAGLVAFRWAGDVDHRQQAARAERLAYRAVALGYPWLSASIVIGAVWAQLAWGAYWSWDPKEVWALITWLLYTLFLHARVMRGWRGRPLALLALVGFASVLFTFLGVGWLVRQVGLQSLHVF